jgi:hypothetical protein
MSMLCLHGLFDVLSSDSRNDIDVKVMLPLPNLNRSRNRRSSTTLCTKQNVNMCLEKIGGESIDRFPQVTILCALASSKEALTLQPLRYWR